MIPASEARLNANAKNGYPDRLEDVCEQVERTAKEGEYYVKTVIYGPYAIAHDILKHFVENGYRVDFETLMNDGYQLTIGW